MSSLKNIAAMCTTAALALVITGCAQTPVQLGSQDAKSPVSGSAGGANAQNVNPDLERCDSPIGTMALVEDESRNYYIFQRRYGFVSAITSLRLLAQQSNCFVVVERGRALKNTQFERQLAESGELRQGSNFGKGQMVAADYSLTPDLVFQSPDTGGIGGAVGGLLGSVGAAVGAAIKYQQAQAILNLIDNRSGIQVVSAEGSSKGSSIGGLLGVGGSKLGGAIGGIAKTPQDKVVVGAYMDAFNNLVRATRNYEAQEAAGAGGHGTGGKLKVN